MMANPFHDLPAELPPGHFAAILDSVCIAFAITLEDLTGKCRADRFVRARHAAAWLLRKRRPLGGKTLRSLPEVARIMGMNDHSTAIHGMRMTEDRAARDPDFAALMARLALAGADREFVPGVPKDVGERDPLAHALKRVGTRRREPVLEDDSDAVKRARGSIALLAAIEAARGVAVAA